ncbi:hypothetical protein HaLaN_16671, partial [Haematococcus lacustris]
MKSLELRRTVVRRQP